jgi:hypothetical protein
MTTQSELMIIQQKRNLRSVDLVIGTGFISPNDRSNGSTYGSLQVGQSPFRTTQLRCMLSAPRAAPCRQGPVLVSSLACGAVSDSKVPFRLGLAGSKIPAATRLHPRSDRRASPIA